MNTREKILYIHQYFRTPNEPGGTRSYWIAKALVADGYNVTIVTTSNKILKNKEIRYIDGIKVVYYKVQYDNSMSLIKRFISFFKFMMKSTYYCCTENQTKFVIATSTPLSVGIPALIVKKLKKVPFLFEVRDLWPEVPIQMGAIKSALIRKLLIYLEKTIYRNSEHIIALSPGMRDGVVKYVNKEKVTIIPNMSKIDMFWPRSKNLELMNDLGLRNESFKVVHFGALGIANDAKSIIESARLLCNENIDFIFLGGGATEDVLKEHVARQQLQNVFFLGSFPMNLTSEIVNFCDISMVSFLNLPILYTNSPNKLFDSLSAGKPIIVNSAGWTKKLVEEHQCGFYINPENKEELAELLKSISNQPNLLEKFGKNSRKLAESKFDKGILCSQFVQIVNSTFG